MELGQKIQKTTSSTTTMIDTTESLVKKSAKGSQIEN